jgi:hypothetical protein
MSYCWLEGICNKKNVKIKYPGIIDENNIPTFSR